MSSIPETNQAASEESSRKVVITGAWSYSGRHIARRLLAAGFRVASLTNREIPSPDPFEGAVQRIPFNFEPDALTSALEGADILACAYWTRHNRPPVGHKGPWLSHAEAAERSAMLVQSALSAGVSRLVWTSIANPGLDPDLTYYAGKALVENSVQSSGLPYAILRPACFFGPGGLLIENIAWAVRRLPVFPIPSGEPYHVRPIHVDDYAELAVKAIRGNDTYIQDATGPDRLEFAELIHYIARAIGARIRVMRLPLAVCHFLYGAASCLMRETILTMDELKGLSRNRLDSEEPPTGSVRLTEWIEENAETIGERFLREPRRRP